MTIHVWKAFFATLNKELTFRKTYATIEEVKTDLYRYIELFYKRGGNQVGGKPEIVTRLCRNQKVEGAPKMRNQWLIPEETPRPQYIQYKTYNKNFTFIDLFCGIGGFHQAMSNLGGRCVFACDIISFCSHK